MVTLEIAGKAGITHKTACEVNSRLTRVYSQPDETIARYQTPRGLAGLAAIVMDLFVRLDPR
ncbi:MAG: hypothetical protein JSW38_08035 [Dehalococcoidia bacterium]|nr:MAG: hypothetical protein JSW38_08035 [Dehalococcoidia bacterium]